MHIKVFGSGCARCQQAEARVREAVQSFGNNAVVEKVTDLKAMMAAGIMSPPGISIDGRVVSTGRIPAVSEVVEWLATAAQAAASSSGGCCRGRQA